MKNTPFTHFHIELGAKMAEFAGYNMPIEYKTGVTDEHVTVRTGVGVFDVSHMGEFWVRGEKALDFVQFVTSNDASKLRYGKVQYSCFPNGKGGIVDDLLVYCFSKTEFLLVVNAANIEKDWAWCNAQNKFGVQLTNESDETAQLAIQGPKTIEALQKLTDVDLKSIEYYTFTQCKFAGMENILISATGYTGAGGFEIYLPNEKAVHLWKTIFEAGKELDIKPIGLAARDTLRLEMGFCLYGNDIDDTTSPMEAGLGWITKFTDYKEFINKDIFLKQKNEGVHHKLVGFEMIDRGIPRHHYELVDNQDNVIGHVTSGTMSPMLKVGIGMGYVQTPYSKADTEIFVKIRNKNLKAKVVKFPFYKA